MDIEKRVSNLENLVDYLSKQINNNKHYTDANIAGTRKSVSDITPYTETKTAYYGETEKTFYGVPEGNVSVFFSNFNGVYSVYRSADRLLVIFETALTGATNITISVQ